MGSIDYTYDVLNRRVIREGDNQYEAYVYDGNQVVADLYYGDLLRTYVWGPGIDNLMSFTDYSTATPTTYYAVKDHQNSVIAMVNASGSVVESYEYDAYGNTRIFNASGTELSESAIGNRYMFQGREYDSATGLYYFRARWYDPSTGRWLSKDPAGIDGGLNQYEFCGSNPVNFVDPSGLWQFTAGFGAGLAIQITFGKNSGRWNFGVHVGVGAGAAVNIVPEDTGPVYADEGFSAKIGAEMTASGGDLYHGGTAGLKVSYEADYCGNQELRGGLYGSVNAGTMTMTGSFEGVTQWDFDGNFESEYETNIRPSYSLGGMGFAGFTADFGW